MFAAVHITLKVLGVALLATLGSTIVGVMLGGDLLIFLSYKILRNDWYYCAPVEGFFLGMLVTILFRVVAKILTDFTGLIQTRHAYDMGGLYWCSNLILAHVSAFVAVYLYTALSTSELINSSFLWTLVAILEGSFLFFFAIFLRTINQSYISTFFTTATGPQYSHARYHLAINDEMRFLVFDQHPSYYAGIRQELRVWLADNWTRWTVDEKPEWLTPRLLLTIPEDLLPKKTTKETKDLRRSARSISSARSHYSA